jgi:hypothetical protein
MHQNNSKSIQISIKEIYEKLCPDCQKKVREIIKERITDSMISDALK